MTNESTSSEDTTMSTAWSTQLPDMTDRWILFLKSTAGRDKIYRLIQYFSRFLAYNVSSTSADLAKRLIKLSMAVGLSRKLFRMGKPLDFIVTVLRVNTIEEDIIVRVGSIMKCLGYGSWLVLDMIQWFCSIGFFTINSETMSSINRIAPRLWLLGIASGALVNLHLLNKYLTLKKSKSTELEFKAESDKVIEKYSQNILQDFIDLLIPLSIMGWIPLTQGTVGLAGSITSLMGAYSIYPAKGESESK